MEQQMKDIKLYARAELKGSEKHPDIYGIADFYSYENGTIISIEMRNLPDGFHGLHIHNGSSCSGADFSSAGLHYNPRGVNHPNHAGDLPPLLSRNGFAWSSFFTSRFMPMSVNGRTIIVHSKPDDFSANPSGNSGDKIACGVITKL